MESRRLVRPLVGCSFCNSALIKGMGTERFGVLMLMWMGIGYCRCLTLPEPGLDETGGGEPLGTDETKKFQPLGLTALAE